MTNKTISVWLILNGKAALQKRSEKEKSFSMICQATWAGKVEQNEDMEAAIKRECKEELGEEFCSIFDFGSIKFFSESNFEMNGKIWTCYNYAGKTTEEILAKAKIHEKAFPEFVFAGKEDLQKDIVLFADQLEVLKNILNGN